MGWTSRLTEDNKTRNYFLSAVSGALFAVAWWLAFDIMAVYSPGEFDPQLHVVGLLGTLSLVLVNLVSNEDVSGQGGAGHSRLKMNGLRLFLMFSLVLGFGALAATFFFLVQYYIVEGR
jgi:hypothetical protein